MDHCSTQLIYQNSSLLVTFLLTGLAGGFTHCLAMCSSFFICNKTCHSNKKCSSKKTTNIRYISIFQHLGRATTYSLLGFICALISKQIATLLIWPKISAAMLTIAGVTFIINSLSKCKNINNHSWSASYLKGIFLGFIPCGLLYAVLMMASSTANPLLSFICMAIFAFATSIALSISALCLEILSKYWQDFVYKISKIVMLLNGFYLFTMAIQLVR